MKGIRATFAAMMVVLGASAYADITLTFFPVLDLQHRHRRDE